MNDDAILALYWQRSSEAVSATDAASGTYCYRIAYGILTNPEDSEESVNDTWLAAWDSIPPTRPDSLKAYLGKLVRRISVSRLRRRLAAKRGGGEGALAMEELSECIPSASDPVRTVELRELTAALDRFLATLPAEERGVFVARYWYACPIADLADRLGRRPGAVKTQLYRTRSKLRAHLEQEGFA